MKPPKKIKKIPVLVNFDEDVLMAIDKYRKKMSLKRNEVLMHICRQELMK